MSTSEVEILVVPGAVYDEDYYYKIHCNGPCTGVSVLLDMCGLDLDMMVSHVQLLSS